MQRVQVHLTERHGEDNLRLVRVVSAPEARLTSVFLARRSRRRRAVFALIGRAVRQIRKIVQTFAVK